jgi:hypothetical protein
MTQTYETLIWSQRSSLHLGELHLLSLVLHFLPLEPGDMSVHHPSLKRPIGNLLHTYSCCALARQYFRTDCTVQEL